MYIGRHFLAGFSVLFFLFLAMIFMFDIVELLRRAAPRPNIAFSTIVKMAVFKLPNMGEQVFPFAALCGGMVAFWRLTRHHELLVTRAAGISAWQFLLPVLAIAFVLGVFKITVLNPFASALLSKYDRLEAVLMKGQSSSVALSSSGLWLRQSNATGQSVIHAKRMVPPRGSTVEIGEVTVFTYEGVDKFIGRIEADEARLEDGFWHLIDAWILSPESPPQFEAEFWLETDLTLAKILDNFAAPETMSFWVMPEFIETLENAGFSAVRHRLHWHSLMATPLLLCAMVLIAATFTLRHARRGGTTFVVAMGVLTGFVFYFFSDLVFALGLSDSIPVTLAAWTPSGVTTLLGLAMLLHLEDG